jgi:hypothetical protein
MTTALTKSFCRSLFSTGMVVMNGAEYTALGALAPRFPEMTHWMNIATMMTMRMGNSALRMNLLTVTLLCGGGSGHPALADIPANRSVR